MEATIDAPIDWVRSVGDFKLPPKIDRRLQELMDLSNEDRLGQRDREELESLVELSERLSLLRAEALLLLGSQPK